MIRPLLLFLKMPAKLVSGIWIYPVKSLGGIRMPSAKVLPKGLEHDRRWMLVDEQKKFITQRDYPAMALFRPEYSGNGFSIQYNADKILLPFETTSNEITANIWDDAVTVLEVSPEHSEWFSKKIGTNCKLVAFPESNQRNIDSKYAHNGEQVSLADGYPLLIIGQASLDDLNNRLEKPVSMDRFRPNLVFTGGEPYEEDNWKNFSIGNCRMAGIKPCGRCTITTVDQQTGQKGTEPLATLSAYRRQGNKVLFGQNLVPLSAGIISEGDIITME